MILFKSGIGSACKRDLEDFFRLHIKVDHTIARSPGITYHLKFENGTANPAVNLFEAVGESSAYLSQVSVADDQIQETRLLTVDATERQLPSQYIKTGNHVSPFIVEGKHKVTGDLEIRVKPHGTNGVWRVAYRTPGDDDGLIVTNTLLFEAPAGGYVTECVLDGVHDQDFPRYLYLRTRTPAVYTRFDMSYFLRPDSCVVSYESSSNPYGTRNLEPDAELEPLWQLRERLTKEARAEITAGKRLNRADLPKLVKEAKEKAAKDKGMP